MGRSADRIALLLQANTFKDFKCNNVAPLVVYLYIPLDVIQTLLNLNKDSFSPPQVPYSPFRLSSLGCITSFQTAKNPSKRREEISPRLQWIMREKGIDLDGAMKKIQPHVHVSCERWSLKSNLVRSRPIVSYDTFPAPHT